MKLSIEVLAEKFKIYNPVLTVQNPEWKVEGVRLLSPYSAPDERYMYIEHMNVIFPTSRTNNIVLVHRNNIIQLESDSLEEVFDLAMEVFSDFSDLERRFLSAASSVGAEQAIADICSEMLGPTVIMDQSLCFRGISAKYQTDVSDELWNDYIINKALTLDNVHFLYKMGLFQNFHKVVLNQSYEVAVAAPYSHALMSTYCDKNGNILGHCIATMKHPPGPTDREIMYLAIRALESSPTLQSASSGTQIQEKLLAGLWRAYSEENEKILWQLMGWKKRTRFVLTAVHITADGMGTSRFLENVYTVVKKEVERHFPGVVTLIDDDNLICCIPLPDKSSGVQNYRNVLEDHFKKILEFRLCSIGVSLPFGSHQKLRCYCQQAKMASNEAVRSGCKPICFFQDIAMDSIIVRSDRDFSSCAIHPLVNLLKEKDEENKTQYLETLWMFLRFNRSYRATSEAMFVHRNTVLYRVEQILQKYPIDLNDAETIEYLLFSFRLVRLNDQTKKNNNSST